MWFLAGGPVARPSVTQPLPAEIDGEEVRASEDAQVSPGIVETEQEALGGIVESAAERESLKVFLVLECGLHDDGLQVVRGGVAVAAPDGEPEVGAAQPFGHPL